MRDAQISGAITGGSITQIPDSGPLTINSPTPGSISVAGELDNWTFFERGGNVLTVALDPGSGATGGPILPRLQWAQAQLLGPSGKVLASASDTTANAILALTNVTLPTDGTYTIAVKAASSHAAITGNYIVAAYDVTANVQSLNVNQTTTGTVPTPYSRDEWTFSAAANTQVQFNLVAESATSLTFSLTGPNEFSGFTNITGSSALITLPTSGTYTLTAQSAGGAVGNFAFDMAQTSLTPLTLGSPFSGTFAGSGQPQLFTVNMPSAAPMSIQLTDKAAADHVELYASFGTPPTRETYDYGANGVGSSQSLLIPNAAAGTWYVLAYAESVAAPPSTFSLSAISAETVVSNFTPNHSGNGADITVILNGAGFEDGTSVAMLSAGGALYNSESVTVNSFEQVSATFGAGSVPAGQYTFQLTLPDGTMVNAPGTFSVSSGGQSQLVTHIILPSSIGYHLPSTIYVQYTNTGTIAMPAPLLLLDATQNGQEGAFLSLDSSAANTFFATSSLPAGFSHSVEILASGAIPGLLEPGETASVPVYYAGWQQPWDFAYPAISFSLKTELASDTTAVNWDDLYYGGINDGSVQTEQTLANIQANLGNTWGNYVAALGQYAANIAEATGENITDASQLSSDLFAGATSAPGTSPPAVPPTTSPGTVQAPYNLIRAPEGSIFWWSPTLLQWVFATSPVTSGISPSVTINKALRTVVIIHGLNNDITSGWQAQMAQDISQTGQSYNILAVDWGIDSWPNKPDLTTINPFGANVLSVSSHIPTVAQEVCNELFGIGSPQANQLGLQPQTTHLIGHSFGAQVAGMIGLDSVEEKFGLVQQITLLDPSSDPGTASSAQIWQGSIVASFVDQYSTSSWFGSHRALGNDDFLVTYSNTSFDSTINPANDADAHSYAYQWYMCTILTANTVANPLNLGWNWHSGSWTVATGDLSDYSINTSGAWKGIIFGPSDYLEAFSPGLDTTTYSEEWDYPLPLASTPPDRSGWNQIQTAIQNSYELSITSAQIPCYWQSTTDEQITFTFQNNDVATILGFNLYDTYDYSYYLSDTPDLSGTYISLGSDDDLEWNDSKAIGNGGITASPIVDMASIDDIDSALGTSGPYYLVLRVEPGGSGTEEYPSDNLYATKVIIDGQGFSADAGGDQVVQDEGDGNGATVTLDGSKSGPDVVPNSYAWTEGDTVLASGTATCTAQFADGVHQVTLTVTGPDGQQASDTATITVLAGTPHKPFNGPPTTFSTVPVGSRDPNAMEGPAGYGSSNFVALNNAVFPYQVNFENSPSATAPAQVVTITDQLDPNLDWSTFQLTTIAWGDTILSIPAGSQHYETTVPMTDNGQTFDVEVEAGIHSDTGEVYASFQSIDPDTDLPPDVLTGFLPPEDGTGRGIGHITFTIQPKTGLPTGTQIRNVALVTFDDNPSIATDQLSETDPSQGVDPAKQALVTINSVAPTSGVGPLPPVTTATSFTVTWSGQDDPGGSGAASYDVYDSVDGGPYALWRTDTTQTSATFAAMGGHTYSFYSVATNNVGNVQPTPTSAQATIQVLPPLSVSSITAVSPNPRNTPVSTVNVTFSLPVNLGSFASSTLALTDDGGPNLITDSVSVALVSGSTYAINGLADLTTGEGNYILSVDSTTILDQYGNPGDNLLSTTWLMDTTPPTSMVDSLPAQTTSTQFAISMTGTDPSGAGGSPPSGVATFAVYVSEDNGSYTLLGTVPASNPSTPFTGQDGHDYGFYSVATDNAGNVQATPSSAQATVQILPPLSVTSIAATSPDPRNTPFSTIDVTLSLPASTDGFNYGALELTDNGGPNLITNSVTVTALTGTNYEISGLGPLTTAEGNYSLIVNAADIQDEYGNSGTGIGSTSWLMDTTPPTSTVNSLPAQTSSTSFLVSASGSDPNGSNGSQPSGIASFTLYVSEDGGAFTPFATVTSADPSGLFTGQAGNTYGFYSAAIDYAGNVQPTPAAAQQIVQIGLPLSISSITPVSPNPRNTAVSSIDVTFSEPINTSSLSPGALTLTDDGGANLINGGVSLMLVSGDTYAIGGLAGLTAAQGLYTLTVNAAYLEDQNGIPGTGSLSTFWLMDTKATTSHVVNSLGTSQTSDSFPVSVAFSDPGGAQASGVSSVDLYVSVNNGPFSLYQTQSFAPTASGTVTFTFVGQDRNLYAFHSLAHDAAGNTETKSGTAIEASTSVSDLHPPVTHILASSPSYSWNPFPSAEFSGLAPSSYTNGAFTINWAGADPDQNTGVPAGSIALVNLYVQVDGGAPVLIGQPTGGTPTGTGVYSGSITYDALADGLTHTYRFYSVGVDDQQVKQYAPQAGPAAPDVTFTETYAAQLAVQNLVVEDNIAERSYIRYLDVNFNQSVSTSPALQTLNAGLAGSSRNSFVELLWYGENLTSTSTPQGSVNLFNTGTTASVALAGNDLSINFGANGLTSLLTETGVSGTGSTTSSFGDGWYALAIDPTGNPSNGQVFWVSFYRLLGDTNGDGAVTGPYTAAGTDAYTVYHAEGQSGVLLNADVNGDGTVNSKDLTETVGANGHAVGGTPPAKFPQFQLFAGPAAPAGAVTAAVTQTQVQALVPEAIAAWQAAGLDPAGVRKLESVQVQVGNLGTSILGLEAAGVITINQTAAGNNWYVNTSAGSSRAFGLVGPGGDGLAGPGSPAAGEVDLLTVLEHELGHVIGLSDNAQAGDLMDITLGVGVRRAPTAGDLATIDQALSATLEDRGRNDFPKSRLSLREREFFRGAKGDNSFRTAPRAPAAVGDRRSVLVNGLVSVPSVTVDAALASISSAVAGNDQVQGRTGSGGSPARSVVRISAIAARPGRVDPSRWLIIWA